MAKVDKATDILLKVGLSQLMLNNFKTHEINQLASIAIAHSKDPNLKNIGAVPDKIKMLSGMYEKKEQN